MMKTYGIRNLPIYLALYLALTQAASAVPQPTRAGPRTSAFVRPVNEAARLIVRRAPYLGNFVVVNMFIDGMMVGSIGYGHTYDGLISPGRHVLSLLPTPFPRWRNPPEMILDVRGGETYFFTARPYSGYLILVPPGVPEPPRGR
jgi:hypothetical protein